MCWLVAAQTSLHGIKKTRAHRENHRDMCHYSKKILVSRNELRETENIGATDLDVLIANFLRQVREFLFLICVKKTILTWVFTQTTREYNPLRPTLYDANSLSLSSLSLSLSLSIYIYIYICMYIYIYIYIYITSSAQKYI